MLRPPSLQKHYDDYFPLDPAFVQLADNASDDDRAAHMQKWETARDTGDFGALGDLGSATKFVKKPIPGTLVSKIDDLLTGRKIGPSQLGELAFRCALVDIVNAPVKVKHDYHEDPELRGLGQIATADVVNQLHEIHRLIVPTLGLVAWQKAIALSPKH